MGQQQTTVAAEEGKGGGMLLRRIILVLTVVTVMAAMLVAMAMPAFADRPGPNFVGKDIQPCRERQLDQGDSQRTASFDCNLANQKANPHR